MIPLPGERVDIGHGHRVKLVLTDAGEVDGVNLTHICEKCPWHTNGLGAFVPLHPANPRAWTLVSREPLTITPSIHFTECGDHGFITNGKWVPA